MYKVLAVFGLVLAISFVCANPAPAEQEGGEGNLGVRFVTGAEIKKLLRSFPNIMPLERNLVRALKVDGQTRDVIQYSLGDRFRGDRRVAHKQQASSWPEPNDVQLELTYPEVGVGAIINYVRVDVDQTSSDGQAYILRGGIGERFMTLIVEANNTYRFNYEVSVFGQ